MPLPAPRPVVRRAPGAAVLATALLATAAAPAGRLAAQPLAPAPAGARPPAPVAAAPATAPDGAARLRTADLVGAAGFAAAFALAVPLDRTLNDRLRRPGVQENAALHGTATVFRRYAQPGVVLAMPALWAIGRAVGDRTTAETGLRGSEAIVLAVATTTVGKYVVGRARPSASPDDPHDVGFWRGWTRGEEYRSFPSGHTTVAFATAAAVTGELARHRSSLRWTAGVPLYAAAGLAGWSRMYDGRHWATDVVTGAAIGTLSGVATGRWHARHPDGWLDRRLLGARRTR